MCAPSCYFLPNTKLQKIIQTTKKHVAFLCIFMINTPHHLRNQIVVDTVLRLYCNRSIVSK